MSEPESHRYGADSFSLVAQSYLIWAEAEQGCTSETIDKRRDCLRQIARIVGEKPLPDFFKGDLLYLKKDLVRRNLSPSRITSILYALRALLVYARDEEGLTVFPPEEITFP